MTISGARGRVLFTAPVGFLSTEDVAAFRAGVERHFDQLDFQEVWGPEDIPDTSGVAAWLCNPGARFTVDDAILDRFPDLEFLVTPSTGKNHIDVAACEKRGIPVRGLLDIREVLDTIRASAEFTFLHILMALRGPRLAFDEVSAGRWRQNEDGMRGSELIGKRVGIVGLGRIGGLVARWSTSFDAEVQYHDPYVDDTRYAKVGLKELFATSDVVCVSCVLTDETRGVIDESLLRSLKKGAVLVNTSRGEMIDQKALEDLLAERDDLRVGIDVLIGEVTASQFASPLFDLHKQGRINLTPHIAGATVESQTKAAVGAFRLLEQLCEQRKSDA